MKHVLITDWHTNKNSLCRHEFKKLLLEAVDESLSILGDLAKRAVYSCLEKNFKIKKQEIPNKIEGFTKAMEEILGPGAKLLQIQIMKHLYETIGRDFKYFPEKDELLFIEYVAAVEASYVETHKQRLPSQPRLL
jgi:hypothetical protein